MRNRKTFDEQEKYDHSAHRTSGKERGDLTTTDTNAAKHHTGVQDATDSAANDTASDADATEANGT